MVVLQQFKLVIGGGLVGMLDSWAMGWHRSRKAVNQQLH